MVEAETAMHKPRITKYRSRLLEVVTAWLSVATIVGGALWGLFVYVANERRAETARLEQSKSIEQERIAQAERENTTRRIEAQKPFLELQFKTYLRVTALVGKIILISPNQDEYKALRKEFKTLYWTELALVEDSAVSQAMVDLESTLQQYEKNPNEPSDIEGAALSLAHAIRDSIRAGWQGVSVGTRE